MFIYKYLFSNNYLIKLLIMLSCIFTFLFIQSFLFSQIKEIDLSIDSRNIKTNSKLYLEQFEKDIRFYILSNNFLETTEEIEIYLDINIIIESISNNIISAHVLFSKRTDQLLFSDGVDFKYDLGQNLLYSTTYNTLTSFLDYNVFIIIAGELDKYSFKGGENYYIQAKDIAFQGTLSEYPRRWNKRLKKCNEMKENIYLRNIKYIYTNLDNHLNTDDEFDEEIIREYLEVIYNEILNIDNDYGYNKETILFLNSIKDELVDLSQEYNVMYLIRFLSQYDKDNSEFYEEFLD